MNSIRPITKIIISDGSAYYPIQSSKAGGARVPSERLPHLAGILVHHQMRVGGALEHDIGS
jgi:hypothetical protein